jgi:hypothetical protein
MSDTDHAPTITDPRIVERGPMGHVTIATTVTHPGEDPATARFVGVRGEYGPVVMILPSGHQVFVTDPGRHGAFGIPWVRSFFAPRGDDESTTRHVRYSRGHGGAR